MPVPMIVLTGGPCGYKSAILQDLPRILLSRHGLTTRVVPEAATLLKEQDITPERVGLSHFQDMIFRHILHLEHLHQEAAACDSTDNTLIICDRGLMDGAAFLPHHDFEHLARRHHFDPEGLRQRYNAVLHLESLAVRQSGMYARLCDGNPVRDETIAEADALDRRIKEAWTKYGPQQVIDVVHQRGVAPLPGRRQRLEAVIQAICAMPIRHQAQVA